MIAPVEPRAPAPAPVLPDQYIASYGKSGGLGCFTALPDEVFARGERVLLQTPRGLELGVILGPATLRQARLLGAMTAGDIHRRLTPADAELLQRNQHRAQALFNLCRSTVVERSLPLEILDVDLLFDEQHALIQFVGRDEAALSELADALGSQTDRRISFENIAVPGEPRAVDGCGKPDCGKTGGAGCSSCGAGGCSSCGNGPVDLTPYFAHLRTKMEQSGRTPLA